MKNYKKSFNYSLQQETYFENLKHFENFKFDKILVKILSIIKTHDNRQKILKESKNSDLQTIRSYSKDIQTHISLIHCQKIIQIILKEFSDKNFTKLSELKMKDILEKINSFLKDKYDENIIKYHQTNIKVLIQFNYYVTGFEILTKNSQNRICNAIQWLKQNSEELNLTNSKVLEFLTFQENQYVIDDMIRKYENIFYVSKTKNTFNSNLSFYHYTKYEFFKFQNTLICIKNDTEIVNIKTTNERISN